MSEIDHLPTRLWAICEDAARSTAARRSALAWAQERRENALAAVAERQPSREWTAGDQHELGEYADVIARAISRHDIDIARLSAELVDFDAACPAPMAPWTAPAWSRWRPDDESCAAIRLGTLHIAEAPDFALPLVIDVPLSKALWLDTADNDDDAAAGLLGATVVRILAAAGPDPVRVDVIDARPGQPVAGLLSRTGVVGAPRRGVACTSAEQVSRLFADLRRRQGVREMARISNVFDAVNEADATRRILVVTDCGCLDGSQHEELASVCAGVDGCGIDVVLAGDARSADRGPGSLLGALPGAQPGAYVLPAHPAGTVNDPWVGLEWNYRSDPVIDTVIESAARSWAATVPGLGG